MSKIIRDFFQNEVNSYSQNFDTHKTGTNFQFGKRLEIACQMVRSGDDTLLDCATGTGEITKEVLIAGKFSSADLIDISSNMINKTRETIDQVNLKTKCSFLEKDIFDYLPILIKKRCQYDLVLCLGLIAHTGRLDELLSLLQQSLNKQGGRVILQSTVADHFGIRLVRLLTKRRYARQKGYTISYYRLEDLRKAAVRNGFRVTAEKRFGLSIPFGDKLWSTGNFFIERSAERWAEEFGSEIIFVLEHNN